MRGPLITRDFLDRAELVYGDRVGIVDEPTQPAPSLGELTYREGPRGPRPVHAGLDAPGAAPRRAGRPGAAGGGRRGAGGRGQPQLCPDARAALRRPVLGPGAGAG